MPLYHVVTYGCQMNKNDSERIEGLLDRIGFSAAPKPEDADLIMINTCSVRQSAEDRVYGVMRNFARLKEKKPKLLLGLTGCMAGRDKDGAIRKRLAPVDFFFPIRDLPQLPRWIAEVRPELANTADVEADYLKILPARRTLRQAYVTIQTGCNKFCSYCVVPFSRGLERNRPVASIMEEVRALVENGCVEVTLLGQTVNAYKAPDKDHFSQANPYKDDFAALLWEVNQVAGIERIHFTAPHPIHMTDETIDALALPKHVNYLHLPVQSGSNTALRRMNRRYTREFYLELIGKIRARNPAIALGTDIIVGFCGETEADFEQTVDLYKQADFDISYTAMYSPRTGTAAYKAFSDDVPREEKKRRWEVLQKLQEETVLRKNQTYLGKIVSVLIDEFLPVPLADGSAPGWCMGNSREMKRVRFPGTKESVGETVAVAVERAQEWVLWGKR